MIDDQDERHSQEGEKFRLENFNNISGQISCFLKSCVSELIDFNPIWVLTIQKIHEIYQNNLTFEPSLACLNHA